MTVTELIILALAGFAAGAINGAVGSGSLVTLPILLSLGLPPTTAITTNTVALVLSSVGGVTAYRREIAREFTWLRPLVIYSFIGAIIGATLLLTTSADAVGIIVAILIGFALIMVIIQPALTRWLVRRNEQRDTARGIIRHPDDNPYTSTGLKIALFGCAVYGGYFAAGQGILLLVALGVFTGRALAHVNGVKHLLTLVVNSLAAITFIISSFLGFATIVWLATAALAVGAMLGGYFGSHIAKRLPDPVLRGIIVIVAIASLARELL